MTWEELLEKQQWVNFYNCNCRGGRRQYYRNADYPDYQIRINTSKGTVTILCKNYVVGPTDWLYTLEQKLIQHEIFKATV